jgi:hypothetical protein
MKDFIRFKPSQRQIYLFERGIVFCKIRMEPSDQGLSPHYSFKKFMKVKGPCCTWGSSQPYGEGGGEEDRQTDRHTHTHTHTHTHSYALVFKIIYL